jgi:hypothetical protein
MTRPISTRVHGLIDYSWAAAATALSSRMDAATSTARLLRGAAATATASSVATNYEAGAIRVLPMKAHLALDYALCAVLVAAPLYVPPHERRYAIVPVLLGLAGFVTALLTQPRSPLELDEEFGVMYGGRLVSEVVDMDPDVVESRTLRLHIE